MRGTSKREHCPKCSSVKMINYIKILPGEDIEVFLECDECKEFVARYTLKMYTSYDLYASYLRLMHERRMTTGSSTKKALEEFKNKVTEDFKAVKEDAKKREDKRRIEELLEKVWRH